MSQQLGECCVSGHLHEGTPKGTEKELYGRATYVTGEENAEKTIVFITDIFGYAFPVRFRSFAQPANADMYLARMRACSLMSWPLAASASSFPTFLMVCSCLSQPRVEYRSRQAHEGDAIDHALMPKIAPRATEPERSIVQKGYARQLNQKRGSSG